MSSIDRLSKQSNE
uniref:Uncharacterized protein n=1 Tax=Lepeophtheirus salmonis TaxID=72036 RepID=A0A0K2V3P2_LEPSM